MPVMPWEREATSGLSAEKNRAMNTGAPKLQMPQVTSQDRATGGVMLSLNACTKSGLMAAICSFMAVNPPTSPRKVAAITQTPMMMTKAQMVSVQATAFMPPIMVKATKTTRRTMQQVT